MAEFTNVAEQTVAANGNVRFSEVPICGSRCIYHRQGSGLVELRGITKQQCRARFLVTFNGNVAIPTGGTVGPISLAISLEGEALGSTTMISTPAAVNEFNNVSASVYVDVPCGCCVSVGITNTSTQPILVSNANLIVTREA